jgi:phosphoglycolate phosphatase
MESIIFDLDGTMWDSTKEAAHVWKEVASKNPAITDEITRSTLKALYGLPLEDIAVGLFKSVPSEVAIATMEECVVAQNPYLAKYKGVLLGDIEGTLKKLQEKYKLFIVSNCKSGYIEAFLEGNQLGKYFEDHLCPGDTGKLKADNIRIIMERNHITSAIYVGDTAGDGKATHEAGLDFVFARFGFGEASDYEYVIDSFEELVPLMDKIEVTSMI